MADHILGDAIRQIKRKLYQENQRVLKIKLVKAQEMGDHELCNTLLADIQRLQREKEALST